MDAELFCQYQPVVGQIASLSWQYLTREELLAAAWAYYYFSVQFRESLNLACEAYADDPRLLSLRDGECDTDNLSPYPDVAKVGEQMNHDEFMRRTLSLAHLDGHEQARLTQIGLRYLTATRKLPAHARAMSIPTYEDGGLETVFRAILTAPDWQHPALKAFNHFLTEHIRFDSDSENGHGALSRHLRPDGETLLLWTYFRDLLLESVPSLAPAEQELCA